MPAINRDNSRAGASAGYVSPSAMRNPRSRPCPRCGVTAGQSCLNLKRTLYRLPMAGYHDERRKPRAPK